MNQFVYQAMKFVTITLIAVLGGLSLSYVFSLMEREREQGGAKTEATQSIDLNSPVPFRYGEQVEVVAGFYAGRRGMVVDFNDDGTFQIQFDQNQKVQTWGPIYKCGFRAESLASIEGENQE